MDPLTTSIIVNQGLSIVTDAMRKDVSEFLQKAFKQGLGVAAGLFSEQVKQWREGNALITIFGAGERLKQAGTGAAAVDPKIFIPLIEAASLEVNATLRGMWSNLLANAADERRNLSVETVYVDVLRQLPGFCAVWLEALYVSTHKAQIYSGQQLFQTFREVAGGESAHFEKEFWIAYPLLLRLQLLEEWPDSGKRAKIDSKQYTTTMFGFYFMDAVRPPSKS